MNVVAPETELTMHVPEIDLSWLDSDEFIPPGAMPIKPPNPVAFTLATTPREKYPATDICTSPDGEWKLSCESTSKGGGKPISHSLRARRKDDFHSYTLFETTGAFETLWSPDSIRFAITDFSGANRSEVMIVEIRTYERSDVIDPSPVLESYFSPLQLSSPRFLKAYRWTEKGDLILRAVGRTTIAPYDLFGYEILLEFGSADKPSQLTFLQGFIKPAKRGAETSAGPTV